MKMGTYNDDGGGFKMLLAEKLVTFSMVRIGHQHLKAANNTNRHQHQAIPPSSMLLAIHYL